jgi:hypothetical protein
VGTTNEEAVRRLVAASLDGRIDDVLDLVHPQVFWEPAPRLGQELYVGHVGVRTMFAEADRTYSSAQVDLDEVTEKPRNVVRASGSLTMTRADGTVTITRIALSVGFLEGLVSDVVVKAVPD